jgi:hypothetical protein
MTTVYGGGGFRLVFRPRKTGPQPPPSLPKRRRSSYSNFRIVRCGGLWQEIRDQERPLSLKWDDLGTLPDPGSIDGVTALMILFGVVPVADSTARIGIIVCVFALIGVAALNIALERYYVHTGVAQELDVSSGGNAEA